jgi:hypothetical protein
MNSMPSASNVLISLFKVCTLLAGIWSFADSSRTKVEKAMFDFSAKSLTVNPVMARAALI